MGISRDIFLHRPPFGSKADTASAYGKKFFFPRPFFLSREEKLFLSGGRFYTVASRFRPMLTGKTSFWGQSYGKNFTSYTSFTFMLMRTSHHNPFRGYSNPGNTMKNIKKRSKNKSFVNKWT